MLRCMCILFVLPLVLILTPGAQSADFSHARAVQVALAIAAAGQPTPVPTPTTPDKGKGKTPAPVDVDVPLIGADGPTSARIRLYDPERLAAPAPAGEGPHSEQILQPDPASPPGTRVAYARLYKLTDPKEIEANNRYWDDSVRKSLAQGGQAAETVRSWHVWRENPAEAKRLGVFDAAPAPVTSSRVISTVTYGTPVYGAPVYGTPVYSNCVGGFCPTR